MTDKIIIPPLIWMGKHYKWKECVDNNRKCDYKNPYCTMCDALTLPYEGDRSQPLVKEVQHSKSEMRRIKSMKEEKSWGGIILNNPYPYKDVVGELQRLAFEQGASNMFNAIIEHIENKLETGEYLHDILRRLKEKNGVSKENL
jgi:hypothetical protein